MQQTTSGSCFQSNAAATVNNQLVGYTYDAPGNLIKNSGTTYFYDDENRLIQVNGTLGNCSTAAQCYSYDAMGRRTEKLGGSTWNDRIYDLSNQVVAQATAGGGAGAYIYFNGPLAVQYTNSTTYFVQTDQLGSTRTMTCFASGTTGCSASQAVYDSMDYLPFGEQIAGDGGSIHKFTGKERDTESGLDMFGARYYGSSLGRFMTPDWAAKPVTVPYANFGNPQSLNLYSYVENNPTTTGDPDGHADWYDTNGRRLGTDGVNDGGVVIQKASAVSYSSDHSLVDVAGSGIPVASFSRAEGNAIQSSVDRTLAPAGGDHQGGFHEEGSTEDASLRQVLYSAAGFIRRSQGPGFWSFSRDGQNLYT